MSSLQVVVFNVLRDNSPKMPLTEHLRRDLRQAITSQSREGSPGAHAAS